jgi:hypothetical protein
MAQPGGAEAAGESPAVRDAAEKLVGIALASVEDGAGRVRVEDFVTVLAAAAGEAALVSAGVLDIETSTIPPGAAVFGDAINVILTGDSGDLTRVPSDSLVGILVRELVPGIVSLDDFGSPDSFYSHVASTVGQAPWGSVSTTVGPDHQPSVLPLRAAFELREAVAAAQARAGLAPNRRYVLCALALAGGLRQVRQAIDVRIALQLALEVVFGMAKMAPMSRAAFDAVARDVSPQV